MSEKESVLKVENLSVAFSMYSRGLRKKDLEVIKEENIREESKNGFRQYPK